jgi:hypothetical protein
MWLLEIAENQRTTRLSASTSSATHHSGVTMVRTAIFSLARFLQIPLTRLSLPLSFCHWTAESCTTRTYVMNKEVISWNSQPCSRCTVYIVHTTLTARIKGWIYAARDAFYTSQMRKCQWLSLYPLRNHKPVI